MSRFENSKDYQFLMLFANGCLCARKNLKSKGFTDEFINRHLAKGWIIEMRTDDIGSPIYGITKAGKDYRDQ